jgi:hypothetical protein
MKSAPCALYHMQTASFALTSLSFATTVSLITSHCDGADKALRCRYVVASTHFLVCFNAREFVENGRDGIDYRVYIARGRVPFALQTVRHTG